MSSTTQIATFYLDKYFFGVEVSQVQEVIRYQNMTRVPLAHPVIQGLINLRGQIVTALDLRKRLEMADRNKDLHPMNIVVRGRDSVVSLLVDEIGDVLEVSNDAKESPPDTLTDISHDLIEGVFKLKGKLLLLLDIEKTITLTELHGSK